MEQLPSDKAQQELLQQALRNAKEQAKHLKDSIKCNNLSRVLKYGASSVNELRTSLLSPKSYYQLYIQINEDLNAIREYCTNSAKIGVSLQSVYDRIQTNNAILPRLYLLVIVGSVMIETKQALPVPILKDLLRMMKGVQYPLRGLFLRHFLVSSLKHSLPDSDPQKIAESENSKFSDSHTQKDSETEMQDSVEESIQFLIENLKEANRLWIRAPHQSGKSQDNSSVSAQDRDEMRLLIGIHIVRLSELRGLTRTEYTSNVLPALLELLLDSNDPISQEYIFECIIQVFPDDNHLSTLSMLLEAMEKCHCMVNVASLLQALFKRLNDYFKRTADARQVCVEQDEAHAVLDKHMYRLISLLSSRETYLSHTFALSFMAFIAELVRIHRQKPLDIVRIIDCAHEFVKSRESILAKDSTDHIAIFHQTIQELIVSVLRIESVEALVSLPSLLNLMQCLPWTPRKRIGIAYIESLVSRHAVIQTTQETEIVLSYLTALVRDDPAQASCTLSDPKAAQELESDQLILVKVIHLFQACESNEQFQMYAVARRVFGQGGVFRIRYTLMPLIYGALSLTRKMHAVAELQHCVPKLLQFVHEMVTALASKLERMSITCVHLFLQCAIVADGCQLQAIAYEFITQSLIVYEDQIKVIQDRRKALLLIIGSLRALQCLASADYKILATKTTQYAAKLTTTHDQTRIVLHCAHLFWHPCHRNGKLVLECLQRALRLADAMESSSEQWTLFLDILEAYAYFYRANVAEIAQRYLKGLSALIREHLSSLDDTNAIKSRFLLIIVHLDSKAVLTESNTSKQ